MTCVTPDCLCPRPDPSEIAERIKQDISINILGGSPIPPGANEDVIAYAIGGAIFELWGARDNLWLELNPETMCCDNLVKYAARRGLYPQSASAGEGFVLITGTDGTTIPSNLSFTDPSGNQYALDPGYSQPVTISNGTATIKVVGVLPGVGSNYSGGLTTESVVSGIDSSVTTIGDGITGGSEVEDCDALRSRVLEALRSGAVSTNAAWYENFVKSYPGINRACVSKCCSACCNDGGIVIYAFGDDVYADNNGIPPKSVLNQITLDLFGEYQGAGNGAAPVGSYGSVTCADISEIEVNISGLTVDSESVRENIAAAFDALIKGTVCPGDKVCKSQFIAALGQIIGSGCVTDVTFTPDENSTATASGLDVNCGFIPVISAINYGC